jgi:SpoVK/Ycf46/Vps4 family AAA+-type ATPase
VLSKWYGDANKFIRAIFTLAAKLEPCIIFIDEVDAFLTKRGGASEHEATLSAKTEFMQLWDGIEGARGMRVLVMGATNRWGGRWGWGARAEQMRTTWGKN